MGHPKVVEFASTSVKVPLPTDEHVLMNTGEVWQGAGCCFSLWVQTNQSFKPATWP